MRDLFVSYFEKSTIVLPTSVLVVLTLVFFSGTALFVWLFGSRKGLKWSAVLLLVEYLVFLIFMVLLLRSVRAERTFYFIPFWSYRKIGDDPLLLAQVILNVLAYVPVGLLLGFAIDRIKWWMVLAAGCAFSIIMEALQFLTRRGFAESDDVFHNTLGCLIGYGLFVAVSCAVRGVSRKRRRV